MSTKPNFLAANRIREAASEWARHLGVRLFFEGRDGAGKVAPSNGSPSTSTRGERSAAALPAPTDREWGQWCYQRYIAHLPAKGEIVLF